MVEADKTFVRKYYHNYTENKSTSGEMGKNKKIHIELNGKYRF